MPNHVVNTLFVINGDPAIIAKLHAMMGPQFDCNAVIPYPEEFAIRDKDWAELSREAFGCKYGLNASNGFNSGGYGWCCEHWGTKWGAYNVECFFGRDGLSFPSRQQPLYRFETAWSPPTPVIRALATKFPELTLYHEYFERGSAYCGGVTFLSKEDHKDHDVKGPYVKGPYEAGIPYCGWHCHDYQGYLGG